MLRPHKPGHASNLHLQGGGQYNQFANPLLVENSGGWTHRLCQLPGILFRRHVVTALMESLYFKGNPASLAISIPPGTVLSILSSIQSAISTEGSVARAHTWSRDISFPMLASGSALWPRVWKRGDCLDLLQVDPNIFPHILAPQGPLHNPPLGFPFSKP